MKHKHKPASAMANHHAVMARADATIEAYRAAMAKDTPPKAEAPAAKEEQAQARFNAFVGKHFAHYRTKGATA